MKKGISILFIILGAILFGYGHMVANRALNQEQRIDQAEDNVQDRRRPLLGPVRKGVYADQTQEAQQQIGTARENLGASQTESMWLRGIGVILGVIGVIFLILKPLQRSRD